MPTPLIDQRRRALHVSEQIERLQSELASLFGSKAPRKQRATTSNKQDDVSKQGRKRRRMSAAARAKIAEAQRQRWAKQKGTAAQGKRGKSSKSAAGPKKKRNGGITPEGRAKLAAAMKARWAARRKAAQ